MPKNNRDKDYDNSSNSGLYGKDSLDHYNEDLSKKAVGSIFSNIERGDSYNNEQNVEEIVINTNFNLKSSDQRRKLVNELYDDSDDYDQQKRRPKQVRPKQPTAPRRMPVNDGVNAAFSRDDDTLAVKYVTRGNHQAVTPASVARRKSVTMMESQRVPIITDEEIVNHKRQTTTKHIAYTSTSTQDTAPINYDDFISRKEATVNQRQIMDRLVEEQNKKDLDLENTLYRLNQKNKHYNEVIALTNERLNNAEHNAYSRNDEFDEFDNETSYNLNQEFESSENLDQEFDDGFDQNNYVDTDIQFDLSSISEEDLDRDFEDTLATITIESEQKSYVQKNDFDQPKTRNQHKPIINSLDNEDYFDVETDTYVTRKSQYSTGEVRKINDTVATEISIDELDNFTFNNYDTADMEYLRKTIKEKSKARKMQSLDDQLHEFEKEYRDFNSKRNVPPKTVPANKPTQKQDSNSHTQNNVLHTQNNASQDSYEYRKARLKQDKPTRYDSDSYDYLDTNNRGNNDVTRQASSPVDTAKINRANTARQDAAQTTRVKTVDLHNDDYDYGDDYSAKFNISLIINIILVVTLLGGGTFLFMKVSSLNKEVENLTTLNNRLVDESDKITELQMDLERYKDLYYATPEGQQSLENINNGNNTDATDTTDTNTNTNNGTSTASGTKYTVVTGDTLSSISKKVYGNSNQYQKIKDANNLTSDSLKIGQELIIP